MTEEEIQILSMQVEDRLEEIEGLKDIFVKKKTAADRANLIAQEAAERYYQLLWLSDILIDKLLSERMKEEIRNPTPPPYVLLAMREQSLKEQKYG